MRSLTARGVKQTLSRAGIDWRSLTITEEQTTARCWSDGCDGFGPWDTYTEVRLAGPKEDHSRAYWALMSAGHSVAGYPDYSLWSKTKTPKKAKAA